LSRGLDGFEAAFAENFTLAGMVGLYNYAYRADKKHDPAGERLDWSMRAAAGHRRRTPPIPLFPGNAAWLELALLAHDILVWMQLLITTALSDGESGGLASARRGDRSSSRTAARVMFAQALASRAKAAVSPGDVAHHGRSARRSQPGEEARTGRCVELSEGRAGGPLGRVDEHL
jgi:hypothetical protein